MKRALAPLAAVALMGQTAPATTRGLTDQETAQALQCSALRSFEDAAARDSNATMRRVDATRYEVTGSNLTLIFQSRTGGGISIYGRMSTLHPQAPDHNHDYLADQTHQLNQILEQGRFHIRECYQTVGAYAVPTQRP